MAMLGFNPTYDVRSITPPHTERIRAPARRFSAMRMHADAFVGWVKTQHRHAHARALLDIAGNTWHSDQGLPSSYPTFVRNQLDLGLTEF